MLVTGHRLAAQKRRTNDTWMKLKSASSNMLWDFLSHVNATPPPT